MSTMALAIITDPTPGVGITISGLSSSTRFTIFREISGDPTAEVEPVRGAYDVTIAGGGFFRDHEVPLGVDVTYRVTVYSGDTSLGSVTRVTRVNSDFNWLQDPLDPKLAIPIACGHGILKGYEGYPELEGSSLGELGYKQPQQVIQIPGARRPVVYTGTRQQADGINLSIAMPSVQDYMAGGSETPWLYTLRAMLMEAGTLVYRPLPCEADQVPVPLTFVCDASSQWDSIQPGTLWRVSGTSAQSPSLRILAPVWTYQRVKDEAVFTTYAAAAALNIRYSDAAAQPTTKVRLGA